MKVLLVKTSSLGDVVHAAPAVAEAARARPDAEFHWLVEESLADIAQLHRDVRVVHTVATRRWRRRPAALRTWSELAALRRRLRAEAYDLIVDAQGLLKSAAMARLAGAPIHGFGAASAREPAAAFFYRRRHEVARDRHAVERTRLLLAAALDYRVSADAADFGLRPPVAPPGLRGRGNLAVLLHGTTWDSKRWPAAHWTELARRLAASGFQPVLPWSDERERKVAEAMAAAAPPGVLFPKGQLADMAGLLAASRLVVGVDTGLMHLAAAFGVPTVSIFASTAPDLTGPLGASSSVVRATLACAPCRQRQCRFVPRGIDPPCHATILPTRVFGEILRRGIDPAAPMILARAGSR